MLKGNDTTVKWLHTSGQEINVANVDNCWTEKVSPWVFFVLYKFSVPLNTFKIIRVRLLYTTLWIAKWFEGGKVFKDYLLTNFIDKSHLVGNAHSKLFSVFLLLNFFFFKTSNSNLDGTEGALGEEEVGERRGKGPQDVAAAQWILGIVVP